MRKRGAISLLPGHGLLAMAQRAVTRLASGNAGNIPRFAARAASRLMSNGAVGAPRIGRWQRMVRMADTAGLGRMRAGLLKVDTSAIKALKRPNELPARC